MSKTWARLGSRVLFGTVSLLASPRVTVAWASPLILTMLKRRDHVVGLSDVRKILVIRPEGIGDVVMMSPLLRGLKRGIPATSVDLVVAPQAFNLVEECPYVERVLAYRPMAVDRWWRPVSRRIEAFRFARADLWSGSYDLAIMPRWGHDYYDSSVLTYFSGAKRRIGFSEQVNDRKRTLNKDYDRYYTQVIDDRSLKHEVERNLDVVAALGLDTSDQSLELWLSEDDEEFADVVTTPLCDHRLIALGPGAGGKKRLWPIERFIRLAEHLVRAQSASIVVVGGPGEESLGRALKETAFGASVIDLVNKATLRQVGAVLRRCHVFCGNDSGTMHLAAAAGIPTIEISCHPLGGDPFHPNSPARFGPWGVPHEIIRPEPADRDCRHGCRSQDAHCIKNITEEAVIQAISTYLDVTPSSDRGSSYG